eukprot:s2147_g15.t2
MYVSGECYEILVGDAGSQGNYKLSITCEVLTNATIKPLTCGSGPVSGSTRNLPDLREIYLRQFFDTGGEQLHQFCPTETGTAEVDTCDSNFDTKVYVYGPGVALDCGDVFCNNGGVWQRVFQGCSGFDKETVTFVFQAGKCYDIIVGGNAGEEGDYVLSIDCFNFTDVECGSNISGSTVGLNGGVQRHRLCSREMTRVEANTCGSNFPTDLQLNDSSIMLSSACADCPNDPNAKCISFNTRCGGELGSLVAIIRHVPCSEHSLLCPAKLACSLYRMVAIWWTTHLSPLRNWTKSFLELRIRRPQEMME